MKVRTIHLIIALCTMAGLMVLLGRTIPAQSAPLLSSIPVLASISGRVTRDDGSPAVGVSVIARSTRYVTPAPAGEALTDANGNYHITLNTNLSPSVFQSVPPPPADTQFIVTIEGQEPLYVVPPSQTVTVPPDLALHGVNFRLTVGPQVTVRVHDALTGQPVPGITVKYLASAGFGNTSTTAGVTDAQGQLIFRIPSLTAYLSLVPPGSGMPVIRAAPGSSFSHEISLPQGKDVVWDVAAEPTTAPTAPVVWHGVVLMQDGRPAAGAKVSILRSGDAGSGMTGKDGQFVISLPPLTEQQYNDRFRGTAILAQKKDQSAVLVPTPDAAWAGTTVRLIRKPLASYSGVVIGPDGKPEANVPVSCRGGLEIAPNIGDIESGITNAQGHFLLSGLPAGHYQVNLGGGPFGPVTLPPSDPGYPYSNTLLTLHDGEQHDFGRLTVLPADQVLAGQIVDHDGKPVTVDLSAIVHGAHTNQMVSLDNQGQFRLYHIVQEPLTLDLYRPDKDGFTRLGQTSPNLFLKVPVQAGRQDVRVVLPAGALPPPIVPPAVPQPAPAAVPVGPPHLAASSGGLQADGLWISYYSAAVAADPMQAVVHLMLRNSFGLRSLQDVLWQGSMTDMNGMQFTVRNNHGLLQDRAGHMLWSGDIQPPQELRKNLHWVVKDLAKPNFLTLQDAQGKKLWSGSVFASGPPIIFVDGDIAVVGPSGTIVWQQPTVSMGLEYSTFDHGKLIGGVGFHPKMSRGLAWPRPPFNGVINFAVGSNQAMFQAQDGHTLYSGPLPTLTLTETPDPDNVRAPNNSPPRPIIICPFAMSNYQGSVTCTLYDTQGRKLQSSTITTP